MKETLDAAGRGDEMLGVNCATDGGRPRQVMIGMTEHPALTARRLRLRRCDCRTLGRRGLPHHAAHRSGRRAWIKGIRGYKLLDRYRNLPVRDEKALADMLLRVGRLVDEVPHIAEMDFYPVKVYDDGKGAEVLDARADGTTLTMKIDVVRGYPSAVEALAIRLRPMIIVGSWFGPRGDYPSGIAYSASHSAKAASWSASTERVGRDGNARHRIIGDRFGAVAGWSRRAAAIAASALSASLAPTYALVVGFLARRHRAPRPPPRPPLAATPGSDGRVAAYYLGLSLTYSLMSIGGPLLAGKMIVAVGERGRYFYRLVTLVAFG